MDVENCTRKWERRVKEEIKLKRVKYSGNAMGSIVRIVWRNYTSKRVGMLDRNCVLPLWRKPLWLDFVQFVRGC